MSIEGSNKTPIHLTASTRVGAFIVAETSDEVGYRDFVKFIDAGEDVLVKKCPQEEAFGQSLTRSLVGAGRVVEVIYLYGGGGSGSGPTGYTGADAFKSVSGPDASGVITLTKGDGSTETVTIASGITFRGGINAGTDSLPATAGLGDAYVVTGDGNNFGDIKGVDYLSEDDILLFINSLGDNDASNPINWLGLQGNIDNRSLSSMSVEDDKQTVDLVANTGLQVDAVNLLNGDIRDVTLLDSSGFVVTSGVQIQVFEKPDAATAPYVILTSNTDLNGVQVFLRGKA